MKTSPPQSIAVIGAGIMGLSAAYALLKSGQKITIYDPEGFPATNASAMAGGMLAPYSEIEHMPPKWVEAGLAGIHMWENTLPDQIKRKGSLLIAHEEDHYILERFRAHLPHTQKNMMPVKELEPQLSERFTHGLHLTEEAHLDPHLTLDELYKIIERLGANLRPSGYEPDELPGDYDWKIDCRGYAAAKDDPDLRGVKGEIIIVRNGEFKLSRPVRLMHPRYPLYIVPRDDHTFMIGATVIESADEQVSLRSGLELMSALYSLHPSFGEAEILEIKAGIRPAYPDNLPRIKFDNNTIRCNGLFRHGFLLAPVMAECVADHIANKNNKFMHLFTGGKNDYHDQRRTNQLRDAA